MTQFVRWLKLIGGWLRRVPVVRYYWWAMAVVVASVGVTGVCGWTEKAFRLTGMLLQLFGVLIAVVGILKTRADFGQPTVRSQFRAWYKTFPPFRPRTLSASVNATLPGPSVEAYAHTTHGPSADRSVDGRLGHLESIVKKLEEAQGKTHIAVLQAQKKAQQALDAQARQLVGRIDGVSKKIEATATGGVHLSAFGVVLLFFGTIFGGAAPELSNLLLTP